MSNVSYKEDFFALHQANSVSSSREIIPLILTFIQPESVVDIGCGIGTWLATWKEKGVQVLGVDGDYVNPEQLLIPKDEFISHDLSKTLRLDRKFDLVTSLEVGEHIHPASAEIFADTLSDLGDVILFSAALPGQGGTYHVNEQYPQYWASVFEKRGFVAVDCIRNKIWDNENISWWYRQNILFFVKKEKLKNYEKLDQEYSHSGGKVMNLVHPSLFNEKTKLAEHYKGLLHNPLKALGHFIKKVIKKS